MARNQTATEHFGNMRKSSDFRTNIPSKGPILFIDMDGVVCDFDGRIGAMISAGIPEATAIASKGLFASLEPISGALESIHDLEDKYEIYFLSTAPWSNVYAWTEKREWIGKHFDKRFKRKLILSSNKGLLRGDYLIDDRTANGVGDFQGEHIHFGTSKFPGWKAVRDYLMKKHAEKTSII